MVDSSEISTTPERQNFVNQRIKGYRDWLRTLRQSHEQGKITSEEMDRTIARRMTAQDLWLARSTDRAKRDPLTGLLNRGEFSDKYRKLIEEKKPFGLLIADIDFFKKINDTHGHLVGDSILIQLALTLTSALRQTREEQEENDIVARYGGEEIAIILRGVTKNEDIGKIAEKLRASISDNPFLVGVNKTTESAKQEIKSIPLTISIGAGIYNTTDSEGDFFAKVDKALYIAKNSGRNRVFVAES